MEGKEVTATMKVPAPEDSTQVIRAVGVLERQATRRPGWLIALALALLAGGLALGTWSLVTLLRTVVGQVEVPKVEGRPADQANRVLRAAGLDPSFVKNEFSTAVPEGLVTRAEPPEGRRVARGSLVRYWVSSGKPIVTVPNVVGLTLQQAAGRLSESGLKVGKNVGEFSKDEPAGTVLDQNPSADRRVRSGDEVDLTVSQGEEKAIVPDVYNEPEADAVEILANAGFRVKRFYEPHPDVRSGRVFDQDPKPNEEVPPGEVVDIFISQGPEQFDMPDVRGETEEDAVDQLQNLGLDVRIRREPHPDPTQRGRVVDQFPAPGTTVERGDNVEITVAD